MFKIDDTKIFIIVSFSFLRLKCLLLYFSHMDEKKEIEFFTSRLT